MQTVHSHVLGCTDAQDAMNHEHLWSYLPHRVDKKGDYFLFERQKQTSTLGVK